MQLRPRRWLRRRWLRPSLALALACSVLLLWLRLQQPASQQQPSLLRPHLSAQHGLCLRGFWQAHGHWRAAESRGDGGGAARGEEALAELATRCSPTAAAGNLLHHAAFVHVPPGGRAAFVFGAEVRLRLGGRRGRGRK